MTIARFEDGLGGGEYALQQQGESDRTTRYCRSRSRRHRWGKSAAGLKSTPTRSRIVLLYSDRLSRRIVTRPSSRAPRSSSTGRAGRRSTGSQRRPRATGRARLLAVGGPPPDDIAHQRFPMPALSRKPCSGANRLCVFRRRGRKSNAWPGRGRRLWRRWWGCVLPWVAMPPGSQHGCQGQEPAWQMT